MRKIMEPDYIRGFLIDALISAMPLKEATVLVDRLLPSICSALESTGRRNDEYDIKVAFAKSVLGSLPAES